MTSRQRAWLRSRERARRLRVGGRVQATAAAHERYYGLVGEITHIRSSSPELPDDVPAVLVNWYDVAGGEREMRYYARKHYPDELMLEGEHWDEDGAYPALPEDKPSAAVDAAQMSMF